MTTNSVKEELVERIVAEVMRRLQGDHALREPSTATSHRTMTLDARVVSLAALERLPADCDRLFVRSDAVVTPAARDELRQRGIEWFRRESESSTTGQSAEARVEVFADESINCRAAAHRQAAFGPMHSCRSMSELIDRVTNHMATAAHPIVAIHPRACEVAWRLNRCSAIRAVPWDTTSHMPRYDTGPQPNVIVLSSAERLSDAVEMFRGNGAMCAVHPAVRSSRSLRRCASRESREP